MPYLISTYTPEKVVLERDQVTGAAAVFIIAGVFFIIIATGLFTLLPNLPKPFDILKYLFLLFGGVAIYTGTRYPRIMKKILPAELIFDNEKGSVRIKQRKDDTGIAYIKYQEITGFEIDTVNPSGSSGGQNRS